MSHINTSERILFSFVFETIALEAITVVAVQQSIKSNIQMSCKSPH